MKRYKRGKERKLTGKAKRVVRGLKWRDTVAVLTVALTDAIWHEGGSHADATATVEIVTHAMLMSLNDWFALEDRSAKFKVVPFKRKRSYFKGKVGQ